MFSCYWRSVDFTTTIKANEIIKFPLGIYMATKFRRKKTETLKCLEFRVISIRIVNMQEAKKIMKNHAGVMIVYFFRITYRRFIHYTRRFLLWVKCQTLNRLHQTQWTSFWVFNQHRTWIFFMNINLVLDSIFQANCNQNLQPVN